MQGFVKYSGKSGVAVAEGPTATLSSSGLRFNRIAAQRFGLRNGFMVEAYYSKELEQLALEIVDKESESTFVMRDGNIRANEERKKRIREGSTRSIKLFSPSISVSITRAVREFEINEAAFKSLEVTKDKAHNVILIHGVKQVKHSPAYNTLGDGIEYEDDDGY